MWKISWALLSGMAAASFLFLANSADAQKKGKEEGEDDTSMIIENLALAYQLAEYGRKNESPESLVAAGGILRKLSKVPMKEITEMPKIEGEGKGEVVKSADLADESEALFQEATALGKKLKVDVEPVIKLTKETANTRGLIGGPRTISRNINGKGTHVFHFQLEPHRPYAVGFHANIPITVTVVRSDNDHVYAAGTQLTASHRGSTGGSRTGRVPVTVRVHNPSNLPAIYTLWAH